MIVLANGVFDCLHYGHVLHLLEASKLGDLYVGLTADEYCLTKRKPVYSDVERQEMLLELPFVKDVLVVHAEHCAGLIAEVEPFYYAKGIDYSKGIHPAEQDALDKCGGRLFITNTPKFATTDLIKRVRG